MKTTAPRVETRYYSKTDLLRRWLKRGERRPHEGALAGALYRLHSDCASALGAVRESRERLDSLHGRVLDLAPRLRDLCWAIDAASAEPEPEPEPVETAAA